MFGDITAMVKNHGEIFIPQAFRSRVATTFFQKNVHQVIQFVTFLSPSSRSLNHLEGSRFHHPKKVTKNCQVYISFHHCHNNMSQLFVKVFSFRGTMYQLNPILTFPQHLFLTKRKTGVDTKATVATTRNRLRNETKQLHRSRVSHRRRRWRLYLYSL